MVQLIPSTEDVRIYEVAVMIQPDLQPHQESELTKEVEGYFSEAGAILKFKDPWSKRGLAFKIKGFSEAKFIIYYYELDPAKIREIDTQLRLSKGVLRHMILIPPRGYEAVSYEEKYQQWLKTRETQTEVKAREKEEQVRERMATQAKREARRIKEQPKKEVKAEPMKADQLDREIDKLISDADLKL